MSEVLSMSTRGADLRSEVVGWTHEDARLVRPGPIGNTPSPRPYASYETPLHALADGWRLLAPPEREQVNPHWVEWLWWFTRERAP